MDFTKRGAKLFRSLTLDAGVEDVFSVKNGNVGTLFSVSLEKVLEASRSYQTSPDVKSVSDPIPLGPWCLYWWERFERGFKLEVTYR
jgi:hypothetical protein